MSLNGMVLRIGQTLGPLTAGLFFAVGGIKGAFFGGAIVALLMIGIVFLSFKPKTMN
jgi:ACDE family multidrug resistance protein